MRKKLLFIVNVDWFFISHRLPIAIAAQKNGYEVHIATKITTFNSFFQSQDFIVHGLDIKRSKTNILSNIILLKKINNLIVNVKPDIVHLVTIKPVLIGGLVTRFLNVPAVVYSVSGLGYSFIDQKLSSRLRLKLINYLYRFSLNHNNSTVIFQNINDLNLISKIANLKESSTILIKGSGVNLEKYSYSPIPADSPIVVLPARLLKDKGVIDYIDAVRLLKNKKTVIDKKVRFVIVGNIDDGNPSSLTEELIDLYKQEGLVEFWGHKSDMVDIFISSSIIVLPSYREGLPKVLIEAAAIGRPVVTTDVPGCRDAIIENVTGLLVNIKAPIELSEAILFLLENPIIMKQMSLAARSFALKTFNIDHVIKTHLNIYDNLSNDVNKLI